MGFPPGKSFYDEWDLPPPDEVVALGAGLSTRRWRGARENAWWLGGVAGGARAKRVPANCELDARAGQHKFDQTDAFSGITNNPVQYSLFPSCSSSHDRLKHAATPLHRTAALYPTRDKRVYVRIYIYLYPCMYKRVLREYIRTVFFLFLITDSVSTNFEFN